MRFGEALKQVFITKYADFGGRASRAEFWIAVLVILLIAALFYLIFVLAGGYDWMSQNFLAIFMDKGDLTAPAGVILFLAFLYALFMVIVIVPIFALSTRRFHDVGLSGWWFAAIIAGRFIALSLPYPINMTVITLLGTAYIAISVWPGQSRANRYGNQPKT